MRKVVLVIGVLALVTTVATAGVPAAIPLSKRVVERETTRLTDAIQHKKQFMARARLTSGHASQLKHSIARMESLVTAYGLIVKSTQDELLLATAHSIIHGELERRYKDQENFRRSAGKEGKVDPERIKALLAELKIVENWQNKAMDSDKK
jgi:hypothetical protein